MMTNWRSLVMAAAVAAALGFSSSAKASPISYSYDGAPDFQIKHPDVGHGGISFVGQSGTGIGPGGGALGADLYATPSSTGGSVGTFTHVGYTTGLIITDNSMPGSPHTFTFGGELNGTLVTGSSSTLTNTFTTPTSQSFQIGSNLYTVHINDLGCRASAPGCRDLQRQRVGGSRTVHPADVGSGAAASASSRGGAAVMPALARLSA